MLKETADWHQPLSITLQFPVFSKIWTTFTFLHKHQGTVIFSASILWQNWKLSYVDNCEGENLYFKNWLLIDNASGHPSSIQDLCEIKFSISSSPPLPSSSQLIQLLLLLLLLLLLITVTHLRFVKKRFDAVVNTDDRSMIVEISAIF